MRTMLRAGERKGAPLCCESRHLHRNSLKRLFCWQQQGAGLQQCCAVCTQAQCWGSKRAEWENHPVWVESDQPEGPLSEKAQGTGCPGPPVMMVIDAGTIQTAQTLQQIKRLFCKVVKEQIGGGKRQPPPTHAHTHTPSVLLLSHQPLFGLLGVITPAGRRVTWGLFSHSYTADAWFTSSHTHAIFLSINTQ